MIVTRKKITAALAAALFALSYMPFSASADNSGKIAAECSAKSVSAGEHFTISINMTENPGINSWRFLLDYDKDAFELTSAEVTDVFSGAVGTRESDFAAAAAYTVSWIKADTSTPFTQTGKIAVLDLKVKDSAKAGSYSFGLSYSPNDVFRIKNETDMENVDFEVSSAEVTVSKNSSNLPVTFIKLSPKSMVLDEGDSARLTVEPESSNVKFSSSDSSVAVVDSGGKVKAIGAGSCIIKAVTPDGVSASSQVRVTGGSNNGENTSDEPSDEHIHSLTKVDGNEPTCTEPGNAEVYVCEECGMIFADPDGTIEISMEDAVLPAVPHTLQRLPAAEPTATEPGNIECWYCTVCEAVFADSNGTQEIDPQSIILMPVPEEQLDSEEALDSDMDESGLPLEETAQIGELGELSSEEDADGSDISEEGGQTVSAGERERIIRHIVEHKEYKLAEHETPAGTVSVTSKTNSSGTSSSGAVSESAAASDNTSGRSNPMTGAAPTAAAFCAAALAGVVLIKRHR